jgi:hypothetical protein
MKINPSLRVLEGEMWFVNMYLEVLAMYNIYVQYFDLSC